LTLTLLRPISEENPSGEYLRYSGIYDQIAEARRADEALNQGDWKTELKVADYRQVINLAVPALSSQTKDLQISVWLAEALTREYGVRRFARQFEINYRFAGKFLGNASPGNRRRRYGRSRQRDFVDGNDCRLCLPSRE
jgi:type VI secretion system protein ImpA